MIKRVFQTALLATFLLTGCGGGGGEGPSSGSGSGAVTIGPPTTGGLTVSLLPGDSTPNFAVTGKLNGDFNSLNGKTVYVTVEDPASLFQPEARLLFLLDGNQWNYELTLWGKPVSQAGHFAGALRIFACLDQGCAQPLAGAPISVPYDVTVPDSLKVSQNVVNVTTPFGTVPEDQKIGITLSNFGSTWIASNVTPYTGGINLVTPSPEGRASTGDLTLRFAPERPGTYTEIIRVNAPMSLPPRERMETQEITVNYTVTPSNVEYFFWPNRLDLTKSRRDVSTGYSTYRLLTLPDVQAESVAVEYLPGSPNSTGPTNNWWSDYWRSYSACRGFTQPEGSIGSDGLAEGVYRAQVRYRVLSISGTQDILMPITLTVTP